MLRLIVLVSLVLVYPVCGGAETYTWVDDQGTINFADDASQVPKKFRNKIKVRGDMGSSGISGGPARETSTGTAPGERGTVGTAQQRAASYGGKSGDQWRMDFAGLKADISATDGQIAEMNARLADTGSMRRLEYLGIQESLKSLRYHREELAKQLAALNEAADRAKVPSEYR